MELAKDIALLRTRRGWTQEELAEHSGVSVRTIRNMELGRVLNPRRSSVTLLARALGLAAEVAAQREEAGAEAGRWRGPQPPHSALIGPRSTCEHLAQTVCANRLTTFHGPGGVGKTRLALGVAAQVGASFEHGVAVVELGGLPAERDRGADQTSAILERVHRQLGWARSAQREASGGEREEREERMLLVLDNAEHVPTGVTTAARELLSGYPRMHILVTARRQLSERLGANREIRPLPVEPAGGGALPPAAELVLRHVGAHSPIAAGLARDLPRIIELCRRLDGLPRYLEFAAERLRTVPIRLLLANGPTTEMLWSNDHALLRHQRSVAESVRWDLDLLTGDHERLLERITALPAPRFSLNDLVAEHGRLETSAAATPLALLSDLLETSLIVADPEELYQYRLAPYVGEVVRAWNRDEPTEWLMAAAGVGSGAGSA
jgi:predicted ATPase/DNA-binding XRE family transcriptional regulator